MAPSRAGSPPSMSMSMSMSVTPGAVTPAALPLPRRLIRQIQRRVADSGRQLRRLEVGGHILDNFDTLDAGSEDSSSDEGGSLPQFPPALRQPYAPMQPQQTYRAQAHLPDQEKSAVVSNGDHDDDLTSLTWLQDRNLLSGINLSKDGDDLRPLSVDFSSQQPSTDAVVPASPCNSPPAAARLQPAPATAAAATSVKPPYSFSCLIFMAIEASSGRALPVKDIYAWILRHFPYFRTAPQGWKNSVRHNLSLNKCFHKVNKGGNTNGTSGSIGKGSLWTVDPVHRPSLLQAFTRAPPFTPRNTNSPPPAITPASTLSPRSHSPNNLHNIKGAPDPQLFPYLTRRLAAVPETPKKSSSPRRTQNRGEDVMDEYAAAAIVLQMKHGPGVVIKLPNRNLNRLDYNNEREELITSSPSQDHAYIAGDGIECPETKVECILGNSSPDHNLNNNHPPRKYNISLYDRSFDDNVLLKKPRWRRSSVDHIMEDGEEEERNTAEVLLSLASGNGGHFGPVRSKARRRRPPPR